MGMFDDLIEPKDTGTATLPAPPQQKKGMFDDLLEPPKPETPYYAKDFMPMGPGVLPVEFSRPPQAVAPQPRINTPPPTMKPSGEYGFDLGSDFDIPITQPQKMAKPLPTSTQPARLPGPQMPHGTPPPELPKPLSAQDIGILKSQGMNAEQMVLREREMQGITPPEQPSEKHQELTKAFVEDYMSMPEKDRRLKMALVDQDAYGMGVWMSRKGIHPFDPEGIRAAQKDAIDIIISESPLGTKVTHGLSQVPRVAAEFIAPGKAVGLAGEAVNVLGKTGKAVTLTEKLLTGAGTFGLHEAMQAPREGESLTDRARSIRDAGLMGTGVAAVGKLIPKTAVRAPVIAGGFAAVTYAQTGDVDAAINSAVMVLGFEALGIASNAARYAKQKYTSMRAGKTLAAPDAAKIFGDIEAELKQDVQRARESYRKTGKMPDDLINKYAVGEKQPGAAKPQKTAPSINATADYADPQQQIIRQLPRAAQQQAEQAAAVQTPILPTQTTPQTVTGEAGAEVEKFAQQQVDASGNWMMPGDTLGKEMQDWPENAVIDLMNWSRKQSPHVKRNVEASAAAELRSRDVPVDTIKWQQENLTAQGGHQAIPQEETIPKQPVKIKEIREESVQQGVDRLVAYDENNDPLGLVSYEVGEKEVVVRNIEVLPESRRKGVGTALISELKKINPDKQIKTTLQTDEGEAFFKKVLPPAQPSPIPEAGKKVEEEGWKKPIRTIKQLQKQWPNINFENVNGLIDIPSGVTEEFRRKWVGSAQSTGTIPEQADRLNRALQSELQSPAVRTGEKDHIAQTRKKVEEGIKELQKRSPFTYATRDELRAIMEAETTDAEEDAVKQILRNRGIDTEKIDIPVVDIGAEEKFRPTIKGKKPSHQEAINLAVEEAMAVVTDVKDVILAQPPAQIEPQEKADKPNRKGQEKAAEKEVVVKKTTSAKVDLTKTKVVDDKGEPLTVFKGMLTKDWRTNKKIEVINSPNGPWAGFFTSKRDVAEGFRDSFATMGDADVFEAKLNITNPLEIDAKGGAAKDFMFDDTVFGKDPTNPTAASAFNKGYDGVIIRNTKDEGDVFVPKDSSQIQIQTTPQAATEKKVAQTRKKVEAKDNLLTDDKGSPLTFYHGTKKKFADKEISEGMGILRNGIYLAHDEDAAKMYGDVKKYHIKASEKDVLDLSDGDTLYQYMIDNEILDADDIEDVDLERYIRDGQIFQYDISSNTHFADYVVAEAKGGGYKVVKIADDLSGYSDNIATIATSADVLVPTQSSAQAAPPKKVAQPPAEAPSVLEPTERTGESEGEGGIKTVAAKYGWKVENGQLYAKNGNKIFDIETKKGRIRFLSKGKLVGSIPTSKPEMLGSILEKEFFAEKLMPAPTPEVKPETADENVNVEEVQIAQDMGYLLSDKIKLTDNNRKALARKVKKEIMAHPYYQEMLAAEQQKPSVLSAGKISMGHDKLPAEVMRFIQGRPYLRRWITTRKAWQNAGNKGEPLTWDKAFQQLATDDPRIVDTGNIDDFLELLDSSVQAEQSEKGINPNAFESAREDPEVDILATKLEMLEDGEATEDINNAVVDIISAARRRRSAGFVRFAPKVEPGLPAVPGQKIPQSIYEKNRDVPQSRPGGMVKQAVKTVDKTIGVISTRLGNINPGLKIKLRKMTAAEDIGKARDLKKIKPFLEKTRSMSRKDAADFDLARKNTDVEKMQQIVKKYQMEKEYQAVMEVRDSLFYQAINVGMDINYIKDGSHPRIIKDSEGFCDHCYKMEDWPIILQAIKIKETKIGRALTIEEKAAYVNTMLRGYRFAGVGLSKPSAAKSRTVKIVDDEINQFYYDSNTALIRYVHTMNSAIAARKFFGKQPAAVAGLLKRKAATLTRIARLENNTTTGKESRLEEVKNRLATKAKKKVEAVQARIDRLKNNPKITGKRKYNLILLATQALGQAELELERGPKTENIDEVLKKIHEARRGQIDRAYKSLKDVQNKLDEKQITLEDSIGAMLMEMIIGGKIKASQEEEVKKILNARFNPKGTSGITTLAKNAALITVLGSPRSAITQIGDLALAVYAGGWRAGPAAIRATIHMSKINRHELGVEHIAQEFVDSSKSAKAVALTLKMVLMDKMDTIGKEALVNAYIGKARAMARKRNKPFIADMGKIFGLETDSLLDDLAFGKKTDNVLFLAYNKLSDFQPISLSEVPETYLTAGNGRVFYMLKTWNIKLIDVFRREAFQMMFNEGNSKATRVRGLKNLIYLATLVALAEGTSDELKDLLFGRKLNFRDTLIDNLLTLVGLGRYRQWRIKSEGWGKSIVETILPPTQTIDNLSKDVAEIWKHWQDEDIEVTAEDVRRLRTWRNVPIVGELFYWWFGRGRDSKRSRYYEEKKKKSKSRSTAIY